MKNMLVSAVIPMFNREKTIRYCLDSVLNQTYKNLEIILVDDCSTDSTIKIIETYNDSRIKIIKQDKNSGAQAARNKGIKEAKGDWITFLDSDDEWFPNKIEQQIKTLEQHDWNPFLVIHSDAILFDTNKKEKRIFGIKKIHGKNVYNNLLASPAPLFPAIFTSKKALETINYLDENVPSYQEWDTSIRLSKICEFVFLEEPTFIYYYHEGETVSKNLKRDIDGYEYILKKFEGEIKKHCGMAIWNKHLKIQCRKSLNWRLYDKARYYLQKMPVRERVKCIVCFGYVKFKNIIIKILRSIK
jgi:glycosyltransferase involved in cell wall biosynthesis